MTDEAEPVRVFLLDDHEVVRRGLADLLAAVPGFEVVGESSTVEHTLERILAVRPDVAILDARLRDGSGLDVCRDVRSQLPTTYCLILTSYDDEDAVLASVLAGASGFLLKEVRGNAIVDSVRQVAMGRSLISPEVIARVIDRLRNGSSTDTRLASLTTREHEVLGLITEGMTNRQIAERLHLAEKTVKNYVSSLLSKLSMQRRTQAAVLGADARRA